MPPKLEKVFTLRGYLDSAGTIDAGPLKGDNGPRQIVVPIPSGYLEGSGVRGELLPGSGDWQTVSVYVFTFQLTRWPSTDTCLPMQLNTSTNVAHLNVRLQLRLTEPKPTDSGASPYTVHIHYDGVVKVDEKAGKILSFAPDAKSTDWGDHYWFSSPMMVTSCPELKWVESSWFVARGRFEIDEVGTAIEYEIYKLNN